MLIPTNIRLPGFLIPLVAAVLVAPAAQAQLTSHIAVYNIETGETRTILSVEAHYEAPNWTPDGDTLIFNSEGRLYRVPVEGGDPKLIDTGTVTNINNDHGLSPDGDELAFTSDGHIYTVGIEGGQPRQLTEKTPSYWHGWSPDGQTHVYCAERSGNFDLYVLPHDGSGSEKRLTTHPGYDDGPDYSPDGKYIYFNSNRSGSWDIWRMPAEGGEPEQVTSDDYEDWFPHPSPDGEHIVFLSYEEGTEGHPANKHVRLRMMPAGGGEIEVLTSFTGGQGTINVPSWSPDSKQFAFTYYELP